MSDLDALVRQAKRTQHGFGDLRRIADATFASETRPECGRMARTLLGNEAYQARSVGVLLLGMLAADSAPALRLLRQRVSHDPSWQVQEILAMAFDNCCRDRGYEAALPLIDEWLLEKHANCRRAVSEGLRIWTARPYFKEHPIAAIERLSALRADESEYVRRSAGNALRDISRKHPDLIQAELETWDTTSNEVRQTYQLAGKFVPTPLS